MSPSGCGGASRTTGAQGLIQYPFNRHYRVEGTLGAYSRSLDIPFIDPKTGFVKFASVDDKYGLAGVGLSGDTTRFQYFGPYQGLRFQIGVARGEQISGDTGSFTQYNVDYRGYLRVTDRSLLAMRVAGVVSKGRGADIYSLGGYNQLRGYEFREFAGSEVAWSNFEFRFPLIDDLRFPFGSIGQLRGLVFVDAGAARFADGLWYDPRSGNIRLDPTTYRSPNPVINDPGNIDFITFRAWDSENNRLQDLRATWGVGFFMLFGGLQIHFDFAHQFPFTQFELQNVIDPVTGDPVLDPFGKRVKQFAKAEVNDGTVRGNFWIGWEF